jgi:hypothetical protein
MASLTDRVAVIVLVVLMSGALASCAVPSSETPVSSPASNNSTDTAAGSEAAEEAVPGSAGGGTLRDDFECRQFTPSQVISPANSRYHSFEPSGEYWCDYFNAASLGGATNYLRVKVITWTDVLLEEQSPSQYVAERTQELEALAHLYRSLAITDTPGWTFSHERSEESNLVEGGLYTYYYELVASNGVLQCMLAGEEPTSAQLEGFLDFCDAVRSELHVS